MPYEERKTLIEEIEAVRGNRTLVSLCNFDRISEPELPGLLTQFQADLKECLYRILKESPTDKGIDLFLYTRGGDTNSVWPIVCLLREFDPDFEVLIPFRAHSAGTMLALSAKKIVMTKLGELSPIDPTTGNQFNPLDPVGHKDRLGISVEDVRAYQDFLKSTFWPNRDWSGKEQFSEEERALLQSFTQKLTDVVHPLALGNVHRVHLLVARLAKNLLGFHQITGRDPGKVVKELTIGAYSHMHMIGEKEATEILGSECVEAASPKLESNLDDLLKKYVDDFNLRSPLFGARLMAPDMSEQDFRFIGGVLESRHWGYLFETKGKVTQHSKLPEGVGVQIPPGQKMPLIPGLPREFNIEIHEQRWHRNTQPEGITT